MRARIHRCAICTATSTFALSRGCAGRAGSDRRAVVRRQLRVRALHLRLVAARARHARSSAGRGRAPPARRRRTRTRARGSRSSRDRAACASPPRTCSSTRRAPRRRARPRSPRPSPGRRCAASCPSSRRKPCRRPTCTWRIISPRGPATRGSDRRTSCTGARSGAAPGTRGAAAPASRPADAAPGASRRSPAPAAPPPPPRCGYSRRSSSSSSIACTASHVSPAADARCSVLADHPQAHPHRLRDRAVGATQKPLLTNNLSAVAHRQSLRGHGPVYRGLASVAARASYPGVGTPKAAVFTTPISGVHDADPGVHDPDPSVHDAPILAFTMVRSRRSRSRGTRTTPRETPRALAACRTGRTRAPGARMRTAAPSRTLARRTPRAPPTSHVSRTARATRIAGASAAPSARRATRPPSACAWLLRARPPAASNAALWRAFKARFHRGLRIRARRAWRTMKPAARR